MQLKSEAGGKRLLLFHFSSANNYGDALIVIDPGQGAILGIREGSK